MPQHIRQAWCDVTSPLFATITEKTDTLYELERQAQANRRGLWVDPEPVPPWEYRRGKRERAARD